MKYQATRPAFTDATTIATEMASTVGRWRYEIATVTTVNTARARNTTT